MRFVTWNCDRKFREKAPSIAAYRPDVLAVQELTRLDTLSEVAGSEQPSFRNHDDLATQWQRGLGLFSFTGLEIEAVDAADHSSSFRRYRARHQGLEFQVVSLWTWPMQERVDNYKQAIQGALRYRDWLVAAPTVVLGDFNDNASYRTTNWPALLEAFMPLGLVSAYHTWTGEEFGHETNSTHFHRRSATSRWHVDYCFIPEVWSPRLTSVRVGSHDEWGKLSDHMPVIVDIHLPVVTSARKMTTGRQ
jgi:endonuclease/exonuclease/phosphatase family metal-dependent hydrolase